MNRMIYSIAIALGLLIPTSAFTSTTDIASFGSTTIQVTPTPAPTPTIQTPTLRPDIETLLRNILTQELSSADRAVLTTELERLLDELTEGQSQISVEYEDDNEEDKTLTITVTPIESTPTIEEESEEDSGSSDNGNDDNDNGSDDPPEEPPIDTPVPPFD
jgi:hypothetical protein